MGNLGDIIFGKTEQPSVQPYSLLSGDQKGLLDKLSKLLTEQVGTGVPSYPGSLTAGPSGMETQGWDALSNLSATAPTGPNQTALDAINKLMKGTTSLPAATTPEGFNVQGYDVGEFDPTAVQNWYQEALVDPSMRTWEKDIVPTIQEKFISQNAGSSGGANRAIAGSGEDLQSNLSALLANALFGEKQAFDTRKYGAGMDEINKIFQEATNRQNLGFTGTESAAGREFSAGQDDLQRLLSVPGLATGTDTAFLNNILGRSNALQSAGATERGIEQSGLNEEYQKWLTSQGYQNPWLDVLSNVLNVRGTENVVSGGTQQSGLLSDVISPALSGILSTEKGVGALMDLLGIGDKKSTPEDQAAVSQALSSLPTAAGAAAMPSLLSELGLGMSVAEPSIAAGGGAMPSLFGTAVEPSIAAGGGSIPSFLEAGTAATASPVISTTELPALLSEVLGGTPAAAGAGAEMGALAGYSGEMAGAGAAGGAAGGTAMATAGPLMALAAMIYGATQTFSSRDIPGIVEQYLASHPNADLYSPPGGPYDVIDRNTGKSILPYNAEERAKNAEAQRKWEKIMRGEAD